MKIEQRMVSALGLGFLLMAVPATAGQGLAIRASALGPEVFQKLQSGEVDEVAVEFREGDQLPITFKAEGDFIESVDQAPSYVAVKRRFFVKLTQSTPSMSFDGIQYQPLEKLVKGSLSVGAQASGQDQVASGLSLVFQTLLRR